MSNKAKEELSSRATCLQCMLNLMSQNISVIPSIMRSGGDTDVCVCIYSREIFPISPFIVPSQLVVVVVRPFSGDNRTMMKMLIYAVLALLCLVHLSAGDQVGLRLGEVQRTIGDAL